MLDFNFCNPTKIIFGKEKISRLKKEILRDKKILMLYGQDSIKNNGVYQQVHNALEGYKLFEFSGIGPNPKYEYLMKAVEIARKEKINFLLAVGGGSVIDGSKFVAAATCFEGEEPWDILAKHAKIKKTIPIGTVLTLPATGSEMNGNAVISKEQGKHKLAFHSPLIFPVFSILDPTTTYSLSPDQSANGIVDAFVHVMEQYLTYPVNSPLQDRMAESILITLIEEGPKVLKSPHDYDVRANIMWCATMALNHLIGVGVPGDWSTHVIGHELTALYGIDHARSLALILPSLMYVKRFEKREKLLQYARRVWGINRSNEGEERAINLAITKTQNFFKDLGIKINPSHYGLFTSGVEEVLIKLESHGMNKLGERGTTTLEVIKTILEHSQKYP